MVGSVVVRETETALAEASVVSVVKAIPSLAGGVHLLCRVVIVVCGEGVGEGAIALAEASVVSAVGAVKTMDVKLEVTEVVVVGTD